MILAMVSIHLISALIQVESKGNDLAVGDFVHGRPTAFGCLQISQRVLDDVTRITGHRVTAANAFRRRDALWICETYLDHWVTKERLGREPTDEDRARVWNGGPDGWSNWRTDDYWRKVSEQMAKTDDGTWRYDFKVSTDPMDIHFPLSSARLPVGSNPRTR